jgi:hypothetical protein
MLISVDTRDESADDLFSQLLRFDDDPSRSEILFEDLSLVQRAHLESSASTLGLEYEYSSISRKLRIFRPSIPSELDPAVEFLNFDPPTTTAGNEELDSVLDPPNDTTFDFDFDGSITTSDFEWDNDLSNFSFKSNIAEAPNLVSSFASQEYLNAFDMYLDKINNIDAFLDEQSSINPSIEAKEHTNWSSQYEYMSSTQTNSEYAFPNAESRSSSISSPTRFRGLNRIRKTFSKTTNIQSNARPGFKEIVFDSRSNHSVSSSASSFQSFSSARSGRLTDAARTMMRAVKAIGACWRCKILRKMVSIPHLNKVLGFLCTRCL